MSMFAEMAQEQIIKIIDKRIKELQKTHQDDTTKARIEELTLLKTRIEQL